MAVHENKSSGGAKDAEKTQRKQKVKEPAVEKLKAQTGNQSPFAASLNNYGGEPSEERHAALLASANSDAQRANLAMQLQQTYGNRYVQRLVESLNGQTKLTVSQPAPERSKGLIARELNQGVQQPKIKNRQGENMVFRWAEEEHKAFGDMAAEKAMQIDWSYKGVTPAGAGVKGEEVVKNKETYGEFIKEEVGPVKEEMKKAEGAGPAGAKPAAGKEAEAKKGVGVAHYEESAPQVNVDFPGGMTVPPPKKVHMSFGDATMLGGDYFKTADDLKKAQSVNPKEVMMKARMVWVALTNVNHFFPLAGIEWKAQYDQAVAKAKEARAEHDNGNKGKADALTEEALRYLAVACHFLQDTFASGHQYPGALDQIGSLTTPGIALEGGPRKTYHDALCALDKGLPMQYGQNFHGDYKADSSDAPVMEETYRAIAHILSIITKRTPPVAPPKPNPGPNVSAIMQDREAGPIWTSMIKHLEEGKLESAEEAAKEGKKDYETSAGTKYSAEDFMEEWKKLGTQKKKPTTTVEKLVDAALRGQSNLLNVMTKEGMTGIGKSTDTKADDEIRAIIKDEGVPMLTHNQAVMVSGALLSGVCGDDDERAFLEVLRNQDEVVFQSVIKEITPEYIDKCLHGKEWQTFLLMCVRRYPPGENLGARLIARKKDDDTARALVFGDLKVEYLPVSADEWIGIINALLSGSCGDDDEDAIVEIVKYLVYKQGKAKLIDMAIGKDKMGSGVDGAQWREVKKIMKAGKVYW